ncbi:MULTISPECIES: AMIN domain-containing protein [Cyanophyceae]|uniref:AMIN domain-containing protein n=1 Tax=Cyanophyceae TaxID=3028117 RepID=UPI00016DC7F4|nr:MULTISPECIES: AMIN domain-containing protein [Cyanophyceae]ACA98511.1 general secretion pathway protein D [Picosynechococcus sp. PCC 7002]SMH41681.1 type II secretion system protein D (GspD) [Picosynechococcus sp. OG1]SMQ78617.1 type II secretion system protein D (GspD) [Synechococcus sp. 7002]
MNIKSYSGVVAGVVASTTVLVTPAQAANIQVRELAVRPGDGNLELALSLAPESANLSGEKPQVSTTQKDRVLIAEIANARLDLGNGQDIFSQDNPLPGIERIEVMESAPGNVKIVALGEVAAPKGEILSQDNNSILLNVTTSTADTTETAQVTEPSTVIEPTLLAQSAPSNNNQNNFLQPTAPIPPFLPRASAPPVGDIAVSTIDTTLPSYVNLQTNAVVPRLVLKEAPIEDVMSLLARASGLNIVVGNDVKAPAGEGEAPPVTVSLDMQNAPVQDVFNYVLMLGDLNAVRNGNTIFVGRNLPFAIAPRITRSFRLNQATPEEARCFLITGDSTVSETINEERTVETAESAFSLSEESGDVPTSRTQSTSVSREVTRTCSKTPTEEELARGLLSRFSSLDILTDARLKTITLGGDPKTIEIASNFLKQLDARQRQVAVNVKIIDVTLTGNRSISSDIKLLLEDRVGISAGDGIILSPNDLARTSEFFSEFNPDSITVERGGANINLGQVIDSFDGPPGTTRIEQDGDELIAIGQRLVQVGVGPNNTPILDLVPFEEGIGTIVPSTTSGTNFIGSLVAGLLRNTTSKIVADPTLIIQENETGELRVTEQIINSVQIVSGSVNSDSDNGTNNAVNVLPEPVLAEVGLFVPITVENIDDNGFITLNITPEVSAPSEEVVFEAGTSRNVLTLKRQSILNSGSVRLRDDQTLILAGAIDERDITTTSKVPILGDIPILGSLFRSSSRTNERRELLFIITPQVIDDSQNAMWGYGYQPSETAREMLDNARFPTR